MELSSALIVALAAAVIGGFIRGFSGFGGALIFMPVASAVFGPRLAAPLFLVMDYILTLPMVVRSFPVCRWPTVLPAAIAGMATAPVGAWILATGDPIAVRWILCLLVMALLALIASGLRFHGEPHALASIGVGGVSGIFGGIGQVSGPPAAAFWMSGPYPVAVIRANLIAFFGLLSLSSFAAYFWNGLFTRESLTLAVAIGPVYAVSLFLGGRFFGKTAGANYRPVVYALIALAALSSMPVFDGFLR
jgi:uncharacterized membrane protein YfcA